MTRRSTFDRLAAAKVAGGASSGDAPATALRQYVDMRIVDIHAVPDAKGIIVIEVGAIGHQSRRLILVEGITRVRDITLPARAADLDAQHDDEIGDEMPGVEQRSDRRPW
jgi:hypothetical protein